MPTSKRLSELKHELAALSHAIHLQKQKLLELESLYLEGFKEQERLQRLLIIPKVIKRSIKEGVPTGIDIDLERLVSKMSRTEILELLSELQGLEEEGKEIEYFDADETPTIWETHQG
jgi:hypothetical protein